MKSYIFNERGELVIGFEATIAEAMRYAKKHNATIRPTHWMYAVSVGNARRIGECSRLVNLNGDSLLAAELLVA